ncbi:short-subunit dehydrogenase [Streptomyces sp. BK022]|uniref:SDR family NAD(P)-dependent oxidoreductase n=1 Tax=Streptomyces sp. BK022 TaxID=2512123 RepID=UPI0010293F54|nr:SDR family NAD(P)-dependent oxidoreductase [Streptomyces sp. BK022]RZU45645.1 short-subunit dehydrogenase [Streptomyces sp. BK022]
MTRSDETLSQGMSALVTGGSRGLGLLIAGQLAGRGCEVTILARDSGELGRAMSWIRRRTGRTVRAVVCDVRDEEAVTAAVDEAAAAHGGLDVVIANAGVIQVAPAEAAGSRAFHDAMATIFYGTLYTCLAALPHLRRSPHGGRLGLIGSVGALVSPPHLVPYSCAKAAVRALGEGLQAETAGSAVSVTTVHPGLMRTGSHLQAEFGGQAEEEYAWFSALSGTPVLSMDAERAAEKIVQAVERRRTRAVLTPAARLASLAHGVAPTATTRATGLAARALPRSPGDGNPRPLRQGHALRSPRTPWRRALSKAGRALNDRASHRYNQRTPGPPTSA